jgi:MFS family permease
MKAVVETSDTAGDSRAPGLLGLPKTVVTLGWVSFLTDVSAEMIFPLIPVFLATLSGTPAVALGFIEGIAEATASTLKIVAGRLADRAKRKKPLVLFGYGISSLARPLVALAPTWPVVLVIRFLDRFGKGFRTAPRDALISASIPADRRGTAFGLHRAFDNSGAVVGPLFAALLMGVFGLGYRSVFALAAIPALASLVVLFVGVTEKGVEIPKERGPAAALTPELKRAIAVMTLFTLPVSSDAFLILKAKEVGVAAPALPLVWALFNAVRASATLPGGWLSDRIGRRPLLLSAWLLYAISYASFAFVTAPLAFVVVLCVYSLQGALAEGPERALIADLALKGGHGRAFGWFHGSTGFASLAASVAFGLIWQRFGSHAAFLVGAVPAFLACLAVPLLPARKKT